MKFVLMIYAVLSILPQAYAQSGSLPAQVLDLVPDQYQTLKLGGDKSGWFGYIDSVEVNTGLLQNMLKNAQKNNTLKLQSVTPNIRYTGLERNFEGLSVSFVNIVFTIQENSKLRVVDCAARIIDGVHAIQISNLMDCTWQNQAGYPVHLWGIGKKLWSIAVPLENVKYGPN